MGLFRKKRERVTPEISTASLPDIIFMLLFFFMVVTVLRKDNAEIEFIIPEVTQSEKIDENTESAYLFVGKKKAGDENYVIQINNKVVAVEHLENHLNNLVASPEIDRGAFEITMKADRNAPMKLIRQIKLAMRKAGIKHLYYMSTPKT